MNYLEVDEFFHSYKPPALYVISSIESKKCINNPIHAELIGRIAYPLVIHEGERGFICFLESDGEYHRLYTSEIKTFTPWKNGEDTVIIETENTKYVLERV